MHTKKGFTLIELMVVVLIVAVLASVLVPMLTARLESAKWSEGKAGAGTLATAIRAMYAEEGESFEYSNVVTDYLKDSDLAGRWFSWKNYSIPVCQASIDPCYPVDYLVRVDRPDPDWSVSFWTLDERGVWLKEAP